jgi:hypothetical protein
MYPLAPSKFIPEATFARIQDGQQRQSSESQAGRNLPHLGSDVMNDRCGHTVTTNNFTNLWFTAPAYGCAP